MYRRWLNDLRMVWLVAWVVSAPAATPFTVPATTYHCSACGICTVSVRGLLRGHDARVQLTISGSGFRPGANVTFGANVASFENAGALGATTINEYRKYIEKDAALEGGIGAHGLGSLR